MAASVDVIKNIAIPAKVPMIAGEQGLCAGGIATLSINYYDLGYETGEMAYEILVNGADIKTMEIKTAPKTTKMYNKANCEALVARDIWDMSQYFQVWNETNEIVQRAVQLLTTGK